MLLGMNEEYRLTMLGDNFLNCWMTGVRGRGSASQTCVRKWRRPGRGPAFVQSAGSQRIKRLLRYHKAIRHALTVEVCDECTNAGETHCRTDVVGS